MRSDEELMAAYVAGDEAGFGELFDRYARMLFRMLRRRIHQEEDVHELVQQTFLQLHRARNDFDAGRKLRPWLVTIAFNLQREYFRRRGRKPEATLEVEPAAEPSRDRLELRDEARRLREALARVPAAQREVIELHWFEELPFPEVAEILGVGLSAVKVRAHRGYKLLRAELESMSEDVTQDVREA